MDSIRDNESKIIDEYEKKIEYLENKVKNLSDFIEYSKISKNNESEIIDTNYSNSTNLTPETIWDIKSGYDKTYLFLKIIIESMPFPVFIKDEDGRYILINTLEANLFGLNESEIIGKDDGYFLKDKNELDLIRKSDEKVLLEKKGVELPEQNFTLPNGSTFIFKTHKIPFINPITGHSNILGFSIDITDTVSLNKLKNIVIMCSNPYM
jgi:PAS domain S-box-containing protein